MIGFIGLGELLSFSRGAWGDYVAGVLMVGGLAFVTSRTSALRRRIVLIGIVGVAAVAGLLVAALSFPKVRAMLEERASLSQSYDVGESGLSACRSAPFRSCWRSRTAFDP